MIKQIAIRGYDKNFSYFVVGSGGQVAIVDPGDVEMLESELEKDALTPAMILITHSHHDHVGGVAELVAKYQLPIYMHARAEGRVELGGGEARYVGDGDVIELDGVKIEVMYTPGHINDAVCYLVDKEALLTGDTLFVEGCGRADFAESDAAEELWVSLKRIRSLNEEVLIYPGHDYGSSVISKVGWEKTANKYLLCQTFEEFRNLRMGRREINRII